MEPSEHVRRYSEKQIRDIQDALLALGSRRLTPQPKAVLDEAVGYLRPSALGPADGLQGFYVWLLHDRVRISNLTDSPRSELMSRLSRSFKRFNHEVNQRSPQGRLQKALGEVLREDSRFRREGPRFSNASVVGSRNSWPADVMDPRTRHYDHQRLALAAAVAIRDHRRALLLREICAAVFERYSAVLRVQAGMDADGPLSSTGDVAEDYRRVMDGSQLAKQILRGLSRPEQVALRMQLTKAETRGRPSAAYLSAVGKLRAAHVSDVPVSWDTFDAAIEALTHYFLLQPTTDGGDDA